MVFIPKRGKKAIFPASRQHLGEIFRELTLCKEALPVEKKLIHDHVLMCLSTLSKYSMSNVVGFIKGRTAISMGRQFGGRKRNFIRELFLAHGYLGLNAVLGQEMLRAYMRHQESKDMRYDQMKLGL